MTLNVLAPLPGTVVALEEVPDPVFSGAIVGPGLALDPHREGEVEVIAPISGTIVKFHPHAFVIVGADGHGVLVHLGLDTVQLGGAGFMLHAAEKDTVEAGQLLVTWSPQEIEDGGRNPISPIVALDGKAQALTLSVQPGDVVSAGDSLFDWA